MGEPFGRLRALAQVVELELVQASVEAAPGEELLVCAHVEDPPRLLHHHDLIGQGENGHPMGDNQGGAVAYELLQNLLDQTLAFQVDLAGSLVEDKNGRVA